MGLKGGVVRKLGVVGDARNGAHQARLRSERLCLEWW